LNNEKQEDSECDITWNGQILSDSQSVKCTCSHTIKVNNIHYNNKTVLIDIICFVND